MLFIFIRSPNTMNRLLPMCAKFLYTSRCSSRDS